ncbi:EamA family transporter [Limnofasciculus baicalensis]|uniref:EamA family transporter n=1 Tax=Limnofasciculus baicalensis BBK-W-15 TaxID=2699891 RepID=A0AAE3KLI4_9CYAN|nr:EamA family transporter [Limnofasciculus baicalensis]MCP2728114.1 EamA family transporter [Limnofasciculus baicalensis BBK-W-15]
MHTGKVNQEQKNSEASYIEAAEDILLSMTESMEGIENLRHNLVTLFSQDVERLKQEKTQLIEEIETLKIQRKEQIEQQQKLVQQITPTLANYIEIILQERIDKLVKSLPVSPKEEPSISQIPVENTPNSIYAPTSIQRDYQENTERLIGSLDTTMRATFSSLEQDLNSYQNSMSVQLSQMYNLEQQAEAILETLIARLKAEIPAQPPIPDKQSHPLPTKPTYPPLPPLDIPQNGHNNGTNGISSYSSKQSLATLPLLEISQEIQEAKPKPKPKKKQWIGWLLILLSLLGLAFENVIVSVILNLAPLPNILAKFGGFLMPTVGNVILLLWMRMVVIVPIMAILSRGVYPYLWRDIRKFMESKDWGLFSNVFCSGFLLFLSQVFLYLSLGSIAPGIAVTIFFIYPLISSQFGKPVNQLSRLAIFSGMVAGLVLITIPGSSGDISPLGILTAGGAGIAFALRSILVQTSGKKLHPIPFLWINLVVVLVFSALSLFLPLPEGWGFNLDASLLPILIISGLVLGGAGILGYLFNHLAIGRIGATRASIIGAIVPVLTALLAFILMRSALELPQIVGMLLVSVGVAALNFLRWRC